MNPRVKQLWLDALRSGKYKQAKNVLRSVKDGKAEGYCCLGVLCDLAKKEGVVRQYTHPGNVQSRYTSKTDRWDTGDALPPTAVMEWAGLSSKNPDVKLRDGHRTGLAALNDQGHSFEEIADLIEEQL